MSPTPSTPYKLDALPISSLDVARLIRKVGPANAAIARYDGLLQSVINPSVMLSPLIRQMHAMLMDSVRGADKSPGQFRLEQNWIGSYDSNIEQASFVPPSPLQLLDFLECWETYIAGEDVDTLIQCAVVHAQFELIHPFKDGNGRIGRLLIPLFLYQKRALQSPMFYLSEYLEANRDAYYARLQGISRDGDWTGWVDFFLTAVENQALSNSNRVRRIPDLYNDMKTRVARITRSQHSPAILDNLFHRPVFQSTDFAARSGIPDSTAKQVLKNLRNAGVLTAIREASGSRPAVLAFAELLNLAEGRQIL